MSAQENPNGRLAGKVAIITGATSGIGRAAAILFARAGAQVLACGRSVEAGKETARLANAAALGGGECLFRVLDVTDERAWKDVVAECVARWGRLDILINNAGQFWVKPIAETSLAEFDSIYRANVEGTWLGMKTAMAHMDKSGGGAIVNVSSLMGQVGFPTAVAYCASKGAITSMTKSAAIEGSLNGRRIRVNSLHPGVVWTKMITETMGDAQELKDFFIAETPLKMLGYPEHLADAILFLASDASSYMTGAELTVDGGRGAD